jgi:hypothetical protein
MAEPIEEYCTAHYRSLLFATHRLKTGGFGPTGSSFSGIPFRQALLRVNSAQIPLSLLYVSSNAILTDMVSNQEWTSFSTSHRALRARNPVGLQRSTYYLGLALSLCRSPKALKQLPPLAWLAVLFRPVHLPLLR